MKKIILKLYIKNAGSIIGFKEEIKPFLKHLAPVMTAHEATKRIHKAMNYVFASDEQYIAEDYLPKEFVKKYFKKLGYTTIEQFIR
ncbi:hypothetical protein KAR28_04480 [Candidatus Parcubacteria bacterium]|nr:hypothetical protein [Candidatus Parcubacteria bacterium]